MSKKERDDYIKKSSVGEWDKDIQGETIEEQLNIEIKQSVERIRELLDGLYDLGFAPYRGYYEYLFKLREILDYPKGRK